MWTQAEREAMLLISNAVYEYQSRYQIKTEVRSRKTRNASLFCSQNDELGAYPYDHPHEINSFLSEFFEFITGYNYFFLLS